MTSTDPTSWDETRGAIRADRVACLVAVAGTARGVFELPRGRDVSIGRSRSSGVRVDDSAVSRLHATLRWDGGERARLTDHGSRNGVLVDGARVETACDVRAGSEIVVGPARFVLVLPRPESTGPISPHGDPAMQRVELVAARAAACDLPVLIVGETGVGKELVARGIHARSARAKRPFVAVNCGAITETLAEATLFGHEKGAFTGAHARREGVFEAANEGTLFLDEIGELSAATQVRLLRSLEEGTITRVGGAAPVRVDARVIAATHRDLDAMVRAGAFRRDLLYRLDVLRITIPPLRERPEDLIDLAHRIVREHAPAVRITEDGMRALRAHAWPGNIRELRNVIARAVAMRTSDELSAGDFAELGPAPKTGGAALRGRIGSAERDAIAEALELCGGNQTKAAARLGISRRALIYKMERHGLKPPPEKP